MFLRRLAIRHVRSIQDLQLDFVPAAAPGAGHKKGVAPASRKWTLLLGENGTGKSTVLRAAALLLAGSDALAELIGADAGRWVRNGAEAGDIEGEIMTADGEVRAVRIQLRREDTVGDVIKRNHDNLRQLDQALRHTARSYLTTGYGVSRRLTGARALRQSSAYRHPRAQAVATLFDPEATLNSLEAWATDVHYSRGDAALRGIKQTLGGLLPGVTFADIDRRRRELLFETVDGIVPLNQLSDGYQNVAAWTGDLLYRIAQTFDDYQDPLAARGLLLIDEIDLHLHPTWQRNLREFLSSRLPNFQILATTHSPLTAQQATEGELYTLRREPGQQPVLYRYPGDPQTLLVHQVLMSDVFGLSSMYSPQVQALRTEYSVLQSRKRRSKAETVRLGVLRQQLMDMPDWTRETPQDRRLASLLETVSSQLSPQRRSSDEERARESPSHKAERLQTTLVESMPVRTRSKKHVKDSAGQAQAARPKGKARVGKAETLQEKAVKKDTKKGAKKVGNKSLKKKPGSRGAK